MKGGREEYLGKLSEHWPRRLNHRTCHFGTELKAKTDVKPDRIKNLRRGEFKVHCCRIEVCVMEFLHFAQYHASSVSVKRVLINVKEA